MKYITKVGVAKAHDTKYQTYRTSIPSEIVKTMQLEKEDQLQWSITENGEIRIKKVE